MTVLGMAIAQSWICRYQAKLDRPWKAGDSRIAIREGMRIDGPTLKSLGYHTLFREDIENRRVKQTPIE